MWRTPPCVLDPGLRGCGLCGRGGRRGRRGRCGRRAREWRGGDAMRRGPDAAVI